MSEKISIQQIADALSQRLTYPKKLTDAFVHSLTDSIVEGLQSDGVVKVKGLGTFKVVEVESRESVNVSDGKRITIPGFKKLSFVPDDAVNDKLLAVTNKVTEEHQDATETPVEDSEETPVEEPVEVPAEELVEAPAEEPAEEPVDVPAEEPQVPVVETDIQLNEAEILQPAESEVKPLQPTDEFSNIDNIIATPEIVDEALSRLEDIRDRRNQLLSELDTYRLQAEEARNNVEAAKEKVGEAEDTVRRAEDSLQQARQNLTDAEAEKVEKENLAEQTSKSLDEVGEEMLSVESEIERLMNEETTPLEDNRRSDDGLEINNVDEDKAAFNFEEENVGDETDIISANKGGNHKVSAKWTVLLVVLLLLFVGVGFLPKLLNKQTVKEVKEEKPAAVEQKDTLTKEAVEPEVKVMPIDSMNTTTENAEQPAAEKEKVEEQVEEKAEEKKTEEVKEEPQRPKTYVIKKGETLTRIAVRFYGSKDAVRKIINANNFANPDNIAVGTTINLP